MSVEILARLQFALTIAFHYIYPPLSIGLGVFLVISEGMYLKTGKKIWEHITRFWIKIFALTFSMGVATGIVMEFEFGTNWATYSRFVGDVFGSALAAEGIFAFFLESGFLALLLFGWDKVKPRTHFFATCMVALGSTLSAVWIVVANSWQQTPAGYHLVQTGSGIRAEITDFWAMVFNPSSVERLSHTIGGCWLAGSFLVISVSAYYLVKQRHFEFAVRSMKIGLGMALVAILFQIFTGHSSAVGVSKNQPVKLAAFEAHYDSSAPGDLYLFGLVDEKEQKVKFGISVPGMLSFLLYNNTTTPVKGLNAFPREDRPPVNFVFQTYHIMVATGFTMLGIVLLSMLLWWKGKLFEYKKWLYVLVGSSLLPQIGNQVGWYSAEVGRQPWVVYGLLRTNDAFSKSVTGEQIVFSLILFTLIYALLFVLFVFLLDKKIKHGPDDPGSGQDEYHTQATFPGLTKEGGK